MPFVNLHLENDDKSLVLHFSSGGFLDRFAKKYENYGGWSSSLFYTDLNVQR